VLFARITPCLENGKTVLVDFLEHGVVGAGSTEFLVFGPDLAGTRFAYCASRWSALREHAIASMTGTSGRQRTQKEAFDHFEMAVPDAGLLAAFESETANLFAAQNNASREIFSLSACRDSLLPRLLSGKLQTASRMEVTDADK
jgi:type I restriction enzyme S subunit